MFLGTIACPLEGCLALRSPASERRRCEQTSNMGATTRHRIVKILNLRNISYCSHVSTKYVDKVVGNLIGETVGS